MHRELDATVTRELWVVMQSRRRGLSAFMHRVLDATLNKWAPLLTFPRLANLVRTAYEDCAWEAIVFTTGGGFAK